MKKNYRLAAWMCILLAIVYVPYGILSIIAVLAGGLGDASTMKVLFELLIVLIAAINCFIYLILKHFLAALRANLLIHIQIGVWVYLIADAVLTMVLPRLETVLGLAALIASMISAAAAIALSVKIIKGKDDASILSNSFAICNLIASGLALTVVLIPVAGVLYPVANLLLARALFRGSRILESVPAQPA